MGPGLLKTWGIVLIIGSIPILGVGLIWAILNWWLLTFVSGHAQIPLGLMILALLRMFSILILGISVLVSGLVILRISFKKKTQR